MQNIDELKQCMVEEWENPSSDDPNLINSMKNRCELILKNNGDKI